MAWRLARAYVAPHRRVGSPEGSVAPHLPTKDKPRKADFGELLAHLLYEQMFGHQIPFSRLWAKPAPNATLQGADCVSVLVNPAEPLQPFTVEVKVRTGGTGSGDLLKEITDSVSITNDPLYLAAAWRSGLDKLDAHPEAGTAYAYSAAQHLALLDGTPAEELPPYTRHALIVTDGADIKAETIEKHWKPPPVSALTIVKITDLVDLIASVYEKASELTIGQLREIGSPDGRAIPTMAANEGLETPVSPGWLAAQDGSEHHPILEASLWYLADHDGIASARAREFFDSTDPTTRVLARLLAGHDRTALRIAADQVPTIADYVSIVQDCLMRPGNLEEDRGRLTQAAVKAGEMDASAGHDLQIANEAICYRLARHPERTLRNSGIAGARVLHVARHLIKQGIHAFWPSQSTAIEAGLLNQPPEPFALRLPTSGGKTTLISLAAANALDCEPGSRVVVLAPSRALVSQLRDDLDRQLGKTGVSVLALHGELEFGDNLPPAESDEDLVTVMTPERFDLDWRRSQTSDDFDPMEANLSAVIVDEAHHLANATRGTRLEIAVSRVLRAGIPVCLMSSQLGGITALGDWIGGSHAESDWRPAHHIRQVYFPTLSSPSPEDPSDTIGLGTIKSEAGSKETRITITRRADSLDPSIAAKERRDQAAALGTQFSPDGPVVVYSATKQNIPRLVDDLYRRTKDDPPPHLLELTKLAHTLPEAASRERDLLLAGIGVHHRDVRQRARRLVERAARAGYLRYLVCTSTLLEGVDFPIRTVILAYPNLGPADVTVGDLRNLEGRAGRGGLHTCGRILVCCKNEDRANHHLHLFRRQLPPTSSQLHQAYVALRRRAENANLDPLDAFILESIADAALTDIDLRQALEDVLGRSLYFAGLHSVQRDDLLARAEERAQRLTAVRSTPWLQVVYRTGLPLRTCDLLRSRLAGIDSKGIAELGSEMLLIPPLTADAALFELVSEVVLTAAELGWPAELTDSQSRRIIEGWLSGTEPSETGRGIDVAELATQKCFDRLAQQGPWLVGASIEILGFDRNMSSQERARLHETLEVGRLRAGTNAHASAELVARGEDRADASRWWNDYLQASAPGSFEDFLAAMAEDEPF